MFLGDTTFVERMHTLLKESKANANANTWNEVPLKQRSTQDKALTTFIDEQSKEQSRNELIRAAYGSGQYSMKAIADHFNLHYTTVSRLLK